jgi:hypothetical protein
MNNQVVATTGIQLPTAAQTESAAFISLIDRLASDPTIDIDRLMRAYELRERAEERRSKLAFEQAFASAQAEIEPVAKRAKNDQTHSNYAKLEAINEAVMPIVTRHGFSVSFDTADCPIEGHYRITAAVSRDGHTRAYRVDIPIDGAGMRGNANKTATHAFGSTISYGRRYLICLIWNISTFDDNDGNRNAPDQRRAPEGLTAGQMSTLEGLIVNSGIDRAKFFGHYRATGIEDFPPSQFSKAVDVLKARVQMKVAKAAAAKD